MPPVATADVFEWVSRDAPPCRIPETPLVKPAGGHRVLSARQRWYFYWQTDWNLALSRPGSGASSGQFFIVSRSCRTKQKVCWSMNHGVLQITELPYLCRLHWFDTCQVHCCLPDCMLLPVLIYAVRQSVNRFRHYGMRAHTVKHFCENENIAVSWFSVLFCELFVFLIKMCALAEGPLGSVEAVDRSTLVFVLQS
jgi:hypothetical protein